MKKSGKTAVRIALGLCFVWTVGMGWNVHAESPDDSIVYYEKDDIEYFSDTKDSDILILYPDSEKKEAAAENTTASEMECVRQSTAALGSAGRLFIPSLGVDVGLYWDTGEPYSMQALCDAWDSAVWFPTFRGGQDIIADHRHQGFEAIKAAVPFQTAAYVKTVSEIRKYICVDRFCGYNTGTDILTGDGYSISYMNQGGLAMYTCNENWQNITITFWQRVG